MEVYRYRYITINYNFVKIKFTQVSIMIKNVIKITKKVSII